jgi:hypothetical protein
MTQRNPKLELTWIGKEHRPKLEPRISLENPEKSYHAVPRVTDQDIFDNRLIFGDNLLALKALETAERQRSAAGPYIPTNAGGVGDRRDATAPQALRFSCQAPLTFVQKRFQAHKTFFARSCIR